MILLSMPQYKQRHSCSHDFFSEFFIQKLTEQHRSLYLLPVTMAPHILERVTLPEESGALPHEKGMEQIFSVLSNVYILSLDFIWLANYKA